jgi:hypothetical protein
VTPVGEDEAFEAFRALGSDTPELDDAAAARIRAAFEAKRDGVAPTLEADRATVADAHAPVATLEPAIDRAPRRRLPVLAAAALVVVVMVLAAALVARSRQQPDVSTGLDVQPLGTLAQEERDQPDQPLRDGEYLHSGMRVGSRLQLPDGTLLVIDNQETWQASDGQGYFGGAQEVVPLEGTATLQPSSGAHPLEAGPFAGSSLSYDELRNLPADPNQLLADVRARSTSDAEAANQLARMLGYSSILTPAGRASVLGAFALLGTEPAGTATDYSGRTGRAFVGHSGPDSWVLVLAPEDNRPLAFAITADPTGADAFRAAAQWVEFDADDRTTTLPA